ncbi:hypothetical protein AX16_002149 [Volvariella volvacea WC 439]|nr:hypothetical protein AX16_002149 [Volvariella volvacea WC 439]
MRLGETLHFSSGDYRKKISSPDYSYYDLARHIYIKRRAITSASVATGASVVSLGITGGASVFAGALSLRNRSVEKQKLELLEQEWVRRGQPPLPDRLRDKVIPIILTTAVGLFAFSVDLGISNAMNPPPDLVAMGYCSPMTQVEGYIVGAYYTVIEKGLHGAGVKAANKIAGPSSRHT